MTHPFLRALIIMPYSACTLAHRAVQRGHFADPKLAEQYPPDLQLEPIHLEIRLTVDLEQATITGRASLPAVC
jgi:hypothetical protein